MKHHNKRGPEPDRFLARHGRRLREWRGKRARMTVDEVLRGSAYGLGASVVPLIVGWIAQML